MGGSAISDGYLTLVTQNFLIRRYCRCGPVQCTFASLFEFNLNKNEANIHFSQKTFQPIGPCFPVPFFGALGLVASC
jgi:hypothetical protein